MSRPGREERSRFGASELERTGRVERGEWSEDIWDEVAFLQRWGGAREIEVRALELGRMLSWWLQGRTSAPAEDLAAIEGLERALVRLKDLHATADVVERQLREAGWELEPESRTLRRVKLAGPEGRKGPGPRKGLLQSAAEEEFRRLVLEEGWPWSNTPEAREEVRRRLMDRFHPDLLGMERNGAIYGALKNAPDPRA